MGTHKRNALLPPLLFYYLVVVAVGRVVRFDWVLCDTGRDYDRESNNRVCTAATSQENRHPLGCGLPLDEGDMLLRVVRLRW